MTILSTVKKPLSILARGARALESTPGVISILHPEQVLSKSPGLKTLYNLTVDEERQANILRRKLTHEVDRIVKTYNINSEDKAKQFLDTLEFYWYNKRLPTAEEAAAMPKWTFKAASDHLRSVEDVIWNEYNKLTDPNTYQEILKKYKLVGDPSTMVKPPIGYVAGHFTHFPIKSYSNLLVDEIKRVEDILRKTPTDDPSYFSLKAHIGELKNSLDRFNKIDTSLDAVRFKKLPSGGYFGPLDEERQTRKLWGYRRDYQDVMHEYVDRATRKIFLDRYMPIADELVRAEPNTALRQYAFDYVTAQRGALASKSRIFWNESLSQLFPNPASGYSNISKAVDFATRFQYLSKIGLSWFRFPMVNSTQPLLTLYPVVGGRNFLRAYGKDIFDPAIWKEAEDVGVVFEMQLRKGLAEALGRTPKISKFERTITAPSTISEKVNRVVAYAAGKRQAMEMGLTGQDAIDHAIKVVNRTQFLYTKAGMPLIMSKSPVGRLIFQFRTFTSNYINYLTQLWREGNYTAFAKALGTLGTLSGTAVFPFGLWQSTRRGLLRNAGIDIGELNPMEFLTERLGFSPPLDFGQSFEPFNIPSEVTQLFGPTIGPAVKFLFDWQRRPEEGGEHFQRWFESTFGPPAVRAVKGFISKEVRTDPTKTLPLGRKIGERSLPEALFLRPPLESTRRKYINLMANAIAGGREDLAREYQMRMKKFGIIPHKDDWKTARSLATRLRGVEGVEKEE